VILFPVAAGVDPRSSIRACHLGVHRTAASRCGLEVEVAAEVQVPYSSSAPVRNLGEMYALMHEFGA
jgi:hypothetical protein